MCYAGFTGLLFLGCPPSKTGCAHRVAQQ